MIKTIKRIQGTYCYVEQHEDGTIVVGINCGNYETKIAGLFYTSSVESTTNAYSIQGAKELVELLHNLINVAESLNFEIKRRREKDDAERAERLEKAEWKKK